MQCALCSNVALSVPAMSALKIKIKKDKQHVALDIYFFFLSRIFFTLCAFYSFLFLICTSKYTHTPMYKAMHMQVYWE